jgi:hypothetical protein
MWRKTDPATSRKAALELIATGALSERRAQVLALLRLYPSSTHGELAALMYRAWPELGILCCAESPHKRLAELEELGLAFTMGERRCRETGKEARVWYPVQEGRLAPVDWSWLL